MHSSVWSMDKKLLGILYEADHFCIDNIPQVEYTFCKRAKHKLRKCWKNVKTRDFRTDQLS